MSIKHVREWLRKEKWFSENQVTESERRMLFDLLTELEKPEEPMDGEPCYGFVLSTIGVFTGNIIQ